MRVIQHKLNDSGWVTEPFAEGANLAESSVGHLIPEMVDGEVLMIRVSEMTQEEFDALEEFTGY